MIRPARRARCARGRDTLDDETRAVLRDTVIREAAGIAALLLLVWMFGPGRMQMQRAAHRARTVFSRTDPYETDIMQFRAEVSRWDHEQAAQQNRRAGGSGPCGCS